MSFEEKVDSIPANCFTYGDYHDGFYQCRDESAMIAKEADVRIAALEEMLRWYVEEDEINEGDLDNGYWIDGKHKAMKLLGMEIKE